MAEQPIGANLRLIRDALHLTQEQVAAMAGIPRTTVAQIEGGKTDPRLSTVLAIAHGLKSRVSALIGETGLIENLVPVPVLAQRIHAADLWPVEAEHLPEVRPNARLVAIEVRGDCMAPKIENGDYVIVDRDRQAEVGKVVVFWEQGAWTLKRLRRRNGHWLLVPDNPAYPPLETANGEVEPLGVVVRVVKPEP